MAEKRKYDIFLSYATHDKPWVNEFSAALRHAGITDWFDAHELRPGERWQEAIEDALRESTVLVVVVSPQSFERPWTFFELGAAVGGHKRIIPVIASETDWNELPPLIRQFQFVREASPADAARVVADAIPDIVESH
jgi:hypothetical protein